jgi:lincosamide nucleotidyltransferase A/C/D/E
MERFQVEFKFYMSKSFFSSEKVLELYQSLFREGIQIWLDGGWGVDALLGKQTRNHSDLDIIIADQDLPKFRKLLNKKGYVEVLRDDSSEWNFVLMDQAKDLLDIHVVSFDSHGNGIYGPIDRGIFYPASSFPGEGLINGLKICCLTPEYQLDSHSGYELKEKDRQDILALCQKFNLKCPKFGET